MARPVRRKLTVWFAGGVLVEDETEKKVEPGQGGAEVE